MSYEYSEDELDETATQQVLQVLVGLLPMRELKKHLEQADYLAEKQKRNNFRRYLLHALKQLNEGLPDDAYHPPALLVLRL